MVWSNKSFPFVRAFREGCTFRIEKKNIMTTPTRYRARISVIQTTDAKTIGERMKRLRDCNMFAEIERMVVCLPNTPEYNENEDIKRAKISLAWNKKDVQTVYRLIEVTDFMQSRCMFKYSGSMLVHFGNEIINTCE